MSYPDFIPKCINEKMQGWNLGDDLYRLLLRKLQEELQSRDECDYRKVVAPIRALILPITLEDPDTMAVRDFVFWINPWIHEDIRFVVECSDYSPPSIGSVSDADTENIRPEFR